MTGTGDEKSPRDARTRVLERVACVIALGWLVSLIGCMHSVSHKSIAATTQPIADHEPQVMARPLPDAIAAGVKFLEESQNKDGSWGTGTVSRGTELSVTVPGSHESFRVATTALAVMALRQAGEKSAHDKGLEFLITHGENRRTTNDLLYNVWAHTYALQCLAIESRNNLDPRIRTAALWQLDRLKRYQTYIGGWNYYDFEYRTQQPSMGPTSFGTAAGLIALWEAKRSSIDYDPVFVNRTIRRLEEMRLPDGAYLYGQNLQYEPRHEANRPQGSIGRTQTGNDALYEWNSKKMSVDLIRRDLTTFFQLHNYIEMGRKRVWPHESWYYTAPYYYYFGHYYASRLLKFLGPVDRIKFAGELEGVILLHQEPDGSWWDYAMWDYHKPYGTAFAVMTLINCQNAVQSPLDSVDDGASK